ncbi:ester cyclase [Haladaptatus sp. DFWS20]|uniref:ester cyclase n=1 Tax=Haladaptatus sp. DFWS20 TaxID=3403467 RepID=UPI003EBAF603
MSTKAPDNEAVALREITEVWNSGGNLDVIPDLVTDDFTYHNPMVSEPVRGPDGYRKLAQRFRDAFSDIDMDIKELLVLDDTVTIRYTTRAIHTGEFMGVEPTQEKIEITGILINHLEDGKIKDVYVNDDALGLFKQIGVVEPPER